MSLFPIVENAFPDGAACFLQVVLFLAALLILGKKATVFTVHPFHGGQEGTPHAHKLIIFGVLKMLFFYEIS
jgi:hypothetical protein